MIASNASRDNGSMSVEFALTMPLFCLVLLAILQAGLVARSNVLVAQAAREGARQATTADSPGEIERAARLAAGGINGASLTIGYSAPEGWRTGRPVSVTASYQVPCLFPGLAAILSGGLRLSDTTTMRLEKDAA
jgi:Flp pilus assembly protein TadG